MFFTSLYLEKIASTAEFRPVSPELITTSPDRFTTVHEKAVPVPTLSLSAPVPYEENTDEQAFHLQKDVLHNIPTQPTPFARSVFTNVRERFQPAMASSPDDGTDPFEFTDETHTPPLRKRKRKSRREKSNKKRKSHDDDRIKRGNEDQVRGNDSKFVFLWEGPPIAFNTAVLPYSCFSLSTLVQLLREANCKSRSRYTFPLCFLNLPLGFDYCFVFI